MAGPKMLSSKQTAILRFIRDFLHDKDYPPSIRDIQDGCSISSTSVVDYNLKALERLGYIKRDREVSRAIELVGRKRMTSVPVVGQIAAGQPIAIPGARRGASRLTKKTLRCRTRLRAARRTSSPCASKVLQ